MLETLYLHATATDAERLLLCLESHLQDQLTAATVISVVLDMDPQEDFEIPPEDSSGQCQKSNCQVRIELRPTDGQALTEDYLDHLGERLLEIFFAVMTDFPEVCFFSILDPD
ncbi:MULTISPECIES: hypothetical protein [Corynebacterium]|uniref:Uncharacterized protein n=1 Tax=Corynebacterium striatum TaxID=43770 RepID=A0ABC8CGP2_CORST|nr:MULTISPECIES: hypothetical protein [Corynebacterium]ATZ07507.1 hypothetical protein A9D01_00785 [Corynebacterium striatum]EGT5613233.1 hypothetical protein [Corynebacterium striatum]KAA1265121.1 hypothetical protein D7S42_08245 [Corynebacterium striatum]OFT60597.1 hypothetical protein HMPREF3148_11715 [Corynebacterium sp. HMSC05D08]QQU77425.1 hypothetical protein I6I72_02315 [Corynebacterium striatum]